ncbi:MAG: protein kinase, partial [Myxococcales bacterium]|nr:protein kinase [Myxococcales bacterium]
MVERTDTPDLASAALGTADTRPDAAATSRDRAERLMDAFDAAADATLAERARILADLRAEDAALADEVEALLAADRGASPIDGPSPAERAVAFAADAVDLDDPGPIGGYRVIRRVGKGGMGVVYEAEQEQPRRRVALKVIRGAFAAPELVKRFEVEAHVLGRLTHDGIARVYAADLSARPPYIVMELIDGLPLDGFVATRGLDLRARVALLADVCDAVHHAHMSGVVHRDLKPGNILVTADGRPKVLDFGVARVLDQDTIHTGPAGQMTGAGDVVGTPAYMSPEQAVGDRDAIDARSDVYALGVILYELVCGRGPYDDAGPALLDVLTAIRDGRAVPLTKRARDVPADVALIVATAMAPERERRYASVAALADDLRRYLADRPIAARPPSVWYGLRKLARRNPLLVAAVAGLFAVLVGAVVVVSALYGEVDQARAVAEAAAADASAANATLRERNAELVLESARAALDANPTLALERLAGLDRAELPTDAPAWRDAFAVAWDATSRGVARAVYGGARAEVRWVEAPPDAAFVVTAAFDDTIRCYEPDGALRWARARPGHRPAWVRLAPGGELAASGGHDGAVVLWRVADGADVVLPGRHEGKVQSGAFSADGRL